MLLLHLLLQLLQLHLICLMLMKWTRKLGSKLNVNKFSHQLNPHISKAQIARNQDALLNNPVDNEEEGEKDLCGRTARDPKNRDSFGLETFQIVQRHSGGQT
eukprot:TRINITY_DN15219_c0_g1_i10.p1 TRINITY_DN15219_c0_g1~~TRINITY_DN15219_c0_g1_i10.p1  ORF type:complete len:102 (+),score=25.07 TRINITY_DN15219_c0_g1_i10:99-404(+)